MSKYSIRVNTRTKGFFNRKKFRVYEIVETEPPYDDPTCVVIQRIDVLEYFLNEQDAIMALNEWRKYEINQL